jgi:hypothetical protein
MFLRDRSAAVPGFHVKDILFRRRPDLGFIELNCENALTPFPYIDTVCEVLEAAVDAAGENDLELIGLTAIPAVPATAKAAVAQAFKDAFVDPVNDGKEQITLGNNFSLSQVSAGDPNRWVVHGDDVTYLLKKKSTVNFFGEILRNTKTSAAELRAYPQYVNPKAYERLRTAAHPMGLPFDLFAEEVRSGFQKTNLERWDLMRTMRGAAPNNPTEGEIAAEYFGISADAAGEFGLILEPALTATTVARQQTIWEVTGASWLNMVGNVKNFLQKTSLEYDELLKLLDLNFINPAGDITIQHLDASCNTEQKVIQVLDPVKLDRIHRFLRLWRKLRDWKMWELDLAIGRPGRPGVGNGVLDKQFLINLYYFSRLRTRLGSKATIEQVCALFGDLKTRTHFTRLHEKRADALYQKLFLNRRLINPLDPAFELDATNEIRPLLDPITGLPVINPITGLPRRSLISDHHPVVLAALGLREADLVTLKGLTKASDDSPYLTGDDLILANVSFLWRHAWLSKLLKLKAEDWKFVLKIFQQDILNFSSPRVALEFVERVDQLRSAGFTPDELNWLLAADRTARSAPKETDAARFLTSLRKELTAIQNEYDQANYEFFSVTPPTDVEGITALLTSLLQQLNRDEPAVDVFIKTLRGVVSLETSVEGLAPGFAFPTTITATPNHIPVRYDQPTQTLRFAGQMTEAQRTVLLTDASIALTTDNSSYRAAIEDLFQQSQDAATNFVSTEIEVVLANVILPADRPSIPIRYNSASHKLSFTGVMTDAERLALIAAGNPAAAINELFQLPRLAVKFYQPVFTAELDSLPAAIDFKAQLGTDTANKITYDAEQRLLRFAGIMSSAEQSALNALVPNVLPTQVAYHLAINSLAAAPQTIVSPDARIWLATSDLDFTLPSNDTLAKRLAIAAQSALLYLARTLSENVVIRQSSAQLDLSEVLTRYMLTHYALSLAPALTPTTLLSHLTGAFAATTGVIDAADPTFQGTFDGWFWASRVATIINKWKLTFAELERLVDLTGSAQLLDFLTLPLNGGGAIASIDNFLRTNRLLRLRDSLPEEAISLLEVLAKLSAGTYPSDVDFAADVERMNPAWPLTEVKALIDSLDLAYPGDYLRTENWERLRRAFYYLDNLNAGANIVKALARAAMGPAQAQALKELLRSKFGEETWLTLCAEIQDALRERKRDALVAYLLTQSPANPPSGKWENANDLYAYYLLDVEMSSCQLTSRLVQGSGSIQLFVHRCFMGLEPDVRANADGDRGDSAWHWWKWMSRYRVWEANRKVFLWPENWVEPELKKDRSSFFKDLENELLQNEINQYTVETAFQNYLEKLDGVAQLEIAGFYQEEDGNNAIVHVFGRTTGAEPHIYYYRRYDYRQWTPWEKVELDIQGDYLIPAVVNKRLFLFWPVFTEVPSEEGNRTMKVPRANTTPASTFVPDNFEPDKTKKKLKLQMAVSDYRQGKWTPKRVSKDAAESFQYDGDIIKTHYRFFPIDRTEADGRFGVQFDGYSEPVTRSGPLNPAALNGSFEISGCKGVPVLSTMGGFFAPVITPEWVAVHGLTIFMRWVELLVRDDRENDFTLESPFGTESKVHETVLRQTPWIFRVSPPWHLSYLDKFLLERPLSAGLLARAVPMPVGSWLPFFYNDKKRTFFVLPTVPAIEVRTALIGPGSNARYYYPEIKRFAREAEKVFEAEVEAVVGPMNIPALASTPEDRHNLDIAIREAFPEDGPPPSPAVPRPPYTAQEIQQIKSFMKRYIMRDFRWRLGMLSLMALRSREFHFKNFYHSFVCDFAKLVYNPLKGIPALMSRETQLKNTGFKFGETYQPTPVVVERPVNPQDLDAYPKEIVDFSPDGAYSPYNWELFFHAPLLIANWLSRDQRFEEAREWYHFIFNPLGVESPMPGSPVISKYWITKPFFETTDAQYVQQRIDNVMRMLSQERSAPGAPLTELEQQVLDWRTNPFEPHRIANYRTVAYQKTVVMKYLDNLVAWGDYLFRQDSMESINEATQLYILAAEILGTRPKKVPPREKPALESFNELEAQFDRFSNALVEVENLVPMLSGEGSEPSDTAPPLPMLYFCIPQNDKMLGYWDTVADRLYKIRHCMNIEGVVRQLALFEPPIDPGALVKAVAAGIDISSALADLNAPLPLYRFNVSLQKANEVCNDVKALGSALLAALEKKDAEALGLLRQSQEIRLLEAVKTVREKQIEEAKETVDGVKRSKVVVETRRSYYRDIQRLTTKENLHLDKLGESHTFQIAAQGVKLAASIISILPHIDLGVSGFGGSPKAGITIGGLELGQAAGLASDILSFISQMAANDATMASAIAGYDRRWDDWKQQERLAERELDQLDHQIAAAELRLAIAEKELDNHVIQIENAKATDAFMRSKYTNQELYQWQLGQVSGVYFQSYRLAYDLAKRAERCFRFELGIQDSSYINFGYWDSLKKGLLSGERLQYDLRRLDTAYLERNRREFEITKHVSLTLLDPLALVKLRETGRCFFRLPEEIFDLDFPGHYFRRIKSVSLTLPCVVGPYTTASSTLRLLKNSIRINTADGDDGYDRNTDEQGLPADDPRFVENNIPVKAIAVSSAQNDGGVFELNFRDERYLPFEGAGAISDWSLELFSDLPANNPPGNPDFGKPLRQFDYNTISDAILHVKFTAREDAGVFKNKAVTHLRNYFHEDETTPSLRMFNLRQEFPAQWHRFLNPTNPADGNVFELEMSPSLFLLRDQGKSLKVNSIWLLARCTNRGSYEVVMSPPLPEPPPAESNVMTLASVNQYGGLHFSQKNVAAFEIEIVPTDAPVKWHLKMTRGGANLAEDPLRKVMEVEDLILIMGYEWEE